VNAQPQGEALQNVFLSSRKEVRIPFKMFVNLYRPDHPTFEVAPTIDISYHGVRVVTKTFWRPDQQVSVRGIRGKLYSRARVVYCQQHKDDSFLVGLELYYPESEWAAASKPPGNESPDQPKPAV
jgi:PilZ domain